MFLRLISAIRGNAATPILGTIFFKESRNYVDTVTSVAAYAWHANIQSTYIIRRRYRMQANREMLFQKNYAKPMRSDVAFIDTFIANAIENGSECIPWLTDMNTSRGRDVVASAVP